MKPNPQPADAFHLFQAHFNQILNPEHPLVRLADKIDWPRFDEAFADSYREDIGAPGKAIRLMVGLHYLKFAFNESVTGVGITDAYVDKGYRGHGCDGATHVHVAGVRSKSVSRSERKRRRRRSAIEPKIGHLKNDHRVRRCFLSGLEGDAINIVLAAAAANLRKLLAAFCAALRLWLTVQPWRMALLRPAYVGSRLPHWPAPRSAPMLRSWQVHAAAA